MRDLRIIFMGTPDFAVTILKHLVENKYTIAGAIDNHEGYKRIKVLGK